MRETIITPDTTFLQDSHNCSPPQSLDSPLQYFSRYIGDDVFQEMAQYTNMYALQKGIPSFKLTNQHEMKTLILLSVP